MSAKEFKDGDKVRIVRKPSEAEFDDWVPSMDAAIGEEGTVIGGSFTWRSIPCHYVRVDLVGRGYNYPDCVLEPALYGNEEDA